MEIRDREQSHDHVEEIFMTSSVLHYTYRRTPQTIAAIMSTSTYKMRSPELESTINVFNKAFIAMLTAGPGHNIDADKLRAAFKAGVSLMSVSKSSC